MYEVDVFVSELTFSLSDRQLHMIAQLLRIASAKVEAASSSESNRHRSIESSVSLSSTVNVTASQPTVDDGDALKPLASSIETASEPSKGKASWLGWAMNVLGGSDDEEEDALESEIIAETKEALLRAKATQAAEAAAAAKTEAQDGPFSLVSCVRLCIRTVSLTLRKHPANRQDDQIANNSNNAAEASVTEELVPVANLGLVRVPVQTTKSRVSRPATPLCTLRAHYVALEGIFVQSDEVKSEDLVVEVERIELLAAATTNDSQSASASSSSSTAAAVGCTLFEWGSIDTVAFANCVSHPYFISSFFGDESRRLNRRETRSFELVKVSFDTEIPVWKTLEARSSAVDEFDFQAPCTCALVWKSEQVPCTPTATLYRVCQDVTRSIGLKERTLDGYALLLTLTAAMTRHAVPRVHDAQKLEDAVAAIANEYQHLRSPDVTATENLQQLLEPQVFALLARQAMHTCGAESLTSSCRSNDIQRRSVHSAVRLRLSASRGREVSNDASNQTTSDDDAARMASRVLDVSLGQAEASLDPSRYCDIVELLTSFVGDIANPSEKQPPQGTVSLAKPRNDRASNAQHVTTGTVLVTLSKLHLDVANDRSRLAQLNVLARDAVACISTGDATVTHSISVGEVAVRCKPLEPGRFAESAVQVVGIDCALTNESSGSAKSDDASRKRRGAATVDRVVVSMSDESVLHACFTLDECLEATTKRSFLSDRSANPSMKTSRTFRLDVCNIQVSLLQSSVWGLDVLTQRSLTAAIGSLSLSSSLPREPTRLREEFHSGASPLVAADLQQSGAASAQSFVTLSVSDQKTTGVACFVPLVPAFLVSEASAKRSNSVPLYRLRVAVKVANVQAQLRGVASAVNAVAGIHEALGKRWRDPRVDELSHSPRSSTTAVPIARGRDVALPMPQLEPAKWHLTVNLWLQGGVAHVNECVELMVPAITVTSLTEDTALSQSTAALAAGGNITLMWSCGDTSVVMHEPSATAADDAHQIFLLAGLRGQLAYDHHVDKQQQHTHAIEGDVHVSRVSAEFSRLQLHYLQKLPTFKRFHGPTRSARAPDALDHARLIQSSSSTSTDCDSSSAMTHLWSFKTGVQLDDARLQLCSDVEEMTMTSRTSTRPVAVEIVGRVSDASVALRIGNHRPTKTSGSQPCDALLTDVQVSVGDIGFHETIHHRVCTAASRFGDFSALSEHSLFGTLLCLDDTDLMSVMAAFAIAPLERQSRATPSPMRTWQLTNQIVKTFRTESSSSRSIHTTDSRAARVVVKTVAIPLLTSWHRTREQMPRPAPLVSLFFRNYGDSSESQKVLAASVECVDVALTTSSVYCLASLLDVLRIKQAATSASPMDANGRAHAEHAARKQSAQRVATLEDLQLSVVVGQVRLILPTDALSASLARGDASCNGNVMLVLESATALSSAWNEISLEGLGYPPFNATKLPRRQRPPSQRLGESRHRLWCKIGKVYGVVTAFARSSSENGDNSDAAGPFEHFLSQHADCETTIAARATETFLLPFNVAIDVEESRNNGQAPLCQRHAALSITKVRLEVRKQEYDVIVARAMASLRALSCLAASSVWRRASQTQPTPRRSWSRELEHSPTTAKTIATTHVIYDVSSDGVEMALSTTDASIHVRIGSVRIVHHSADESGNFSVQNLVAGFRAADSRSHSALLSSEELVLGAFADPGLWQLRADNHPEKLLSGRWSSLDRKERTVFLDLQSYQLHLSVRFLEQLQRFVQCNTPSHFAARAARVPVATARRAHDPERSVYVPRRKTTVKVLIAPSVMSLWDRTLPSQSSDTATSVWVSCGQVFASVGIGAENGSSRQKALVSSGDAIHALNQYVAVRESEFMLNVEKIGVQASSDFPVVRIGFRFGTVGSLPSHVESTWTSFVRHVTSGSARFRLLDDCTLRATGDLSRVLEQQQQPHDRDENTLTLASTTLSRLNVQCEVSAVEVKISSHSVESLASILSAVQRTLKTRPHARSTRSSTTENSRRSPVFAVAKQALTSTDDFNYLQRVGEARHPAPGELVLSESLFIETGNSSEALLQARQADTAVHIDELQFSNYEQIEDDDLLAFIEEINAPWESDSADAAADVASLPAFENRTMSWMGMRWRYYIPRVIDEIVANPVPIPPTGMPAGWPVWHGGSTDPNRQSGRLCDVFCQLRCWDYRSNRFVIVSEFFVPFERSASGPYRLDASEMYEPESFGDFVTQWFEEDMEDYAYHAKLLELASATRRVRFRDGPPSDKWELRWRSPLSIDREAEVRLSVSLHC